jgi:peptidylglycine monooxygenase
MIHCFSSEGTHKHSWGGRGSGPGEFSIPHGIWVLSDGRILVGDRENKRIQVFKADGTYLTEWKEFYRPMDFYADEHDCVYVTELLPRVTKLKDGVVIGSCKAVATFAHGMRGDSQGNIFLVERRAPTITKLEFTEQVGRA